jgi:secreted PhoX family phosphatase
MSTLNRRRFLSLLSVAAAGTAVAPLGKLYAHGQHFQSLPRPQPGLCLANGVGEGFGPLIPTLPANAAELTSTVAGDLSQVPLLKLPQGFSYTALSITGQAMGDGSPVPSGHDGMACFQGRRGNYVLVRNHERNPGGSGCLPPNGKVYDPFLLAPGQGGGGTSTLILDRHGRLVHDYISLGGTIRNCAGGLTPWDSWISCEENTSTPTNSATVTKKHGYNFEVPALLGEAVDPIPLVAMGRFNHEAVACEPRSGHVYQTEDRGDSLFYRFIPHDRHPRRFGDLQQGGTLYAMVIDANTSAVCDGTNLPVTDASVDTRTGVQSFLGQPLPVSWVQLEDVDPAEDTLRFEGQAKGAALFARGEGAWYGDGLIYFVASGGGDMGNGQVWAYDPRRETVTLLVESTAEGVLDNPDNITVAPDGTLYLCEDGGGVDFVVGVDHDGNLFPFVENNFNTSEFCGACFSSDGRFMFVNMQSFGVTFAIYRDDRRPIALHDRRQPRK